MPHAASIMYMSQNDTEQRVFANHSIFGKFPHNWLFTKVLHTPILKFAYHQVTSRPKQILF